MIALQARSEYINDVMHFTLKAADSSSCKYIDSQSELRACCQIKVLIYIYGSSETLDPVNFDREKYIYIRHFEICYVILRTQIHHMLYIYAKVVTRRRKLNGSY